MIRSFATTPASTPMSPTSSSIKNGAGKVSLRCFSMSLKPRCGCGMLAYPRLLQGSKSACSRLLHRPRLSTVRDRFHETAQRREAVIPHGLNGVAEGRPPSSSLEEDGHVLLNGHPAQVDHPAEQWVAVDVEEAVAQGYGHDVELAGDLGLPTIGKRLRRKGSQLRVDEREFTFQCDGLVCSPLAVIVHMQHERREPGSPAVWLQTRRDGVAQPPEVAIRADLHAIKLLFAITGSKYTEIETHFTLSVPIRADVIRHNSSSVWSS